MPKYLTKGSFTIGHQAGSTAEAEDQMKSFVARMMAAVEDGVFVDETSMGATCNPVSEYQPITLLDLEENVKSEPKEQ